MAETMIEARDLSRRFGHVLALDGVNFKVPGGQVVGLLGPNGAGKTTAMRILTGFLAASGGIALVDGRDVVEDPLHCRQKVGYLPEGNPLYTDLRIEEALRFTARMRGLRGPDVREAVRESIHTAGLAGWERRLIGTVSKGYRQRVGLAQALLHRPDILILDEPTSGLDPIQQREAYDLIRQLGEKHTVILSTHHLPQIEDVADRFLIINQGRLVVDGSFEDIKRQAVSRPEVVMLVRGSEQAVRDALVSVHRAEDAQLVPVGGVSEHVRVRVPVDDAEGPADAERVAEVMRKHSLPLAELSYSSLTLEQFFFEFTSATPAPLAAEKATPPEDAVDAAAPAAPASSEEV